MKRQIVASSRYGDKTTLRIIKERLDELSDLIEDADDDTYQAIQGDEISRSVLNALSYVNDAYDAVIRSERYE